jgi:hypothetical protein
MKKLVIGMLLFIAAIAAVGLVTLPAMTHTAYAATTGTGSFATDDFAASTSSASTKGPSGASSGTIAVCPDFVVLHGTCSESAP